MKTAASFTAYVLFFCAMMVAATILAPYLPWNH